MRADPGSAKRRVAALRVLGLAIFALVVLFALPAIGNLTFNSHYSAYFSDDDPWRLQQQAIAETFSRGDSVFIVLEADQASFLAEELYTALEDLTAELARLPDVMSVLSVTELGIAGEPASEGGALIPSMQQLRNHGRAVGLLLSADARIAGINVEFQLPDRQAKTVLKTLDAVRNVVEPRLASLSVNAHYTGSLALNEAYIGVVRHDLAVIMPLLLLLMVVLPGWLVGSWRAVIIALPVGVGALLAGFGLAGRLHAELAAVNSFVPVILLGISLAGCVHMALTYMRLRQAGEAPEAAAWHAVRYNVAPMALANGTTVLGFLGLLLSPSPPIRVLGYVVAAGVATSFLLCMTLLPALQARFDPVARRARSREFRAGAFAHLATRRRAAIIAVCALLALPASWLVSRNVVSDNVLEYFPDTHAFHAGTALVEERLSGITELVYAVDTRDEDGLFRASVVESVDAFGDWLRAQPEVIRVTSVADAEALVEARAAGRLQDRLAYYREQARQRTGSHPLVAREVSGDYSATAVGAYLYRSDSSGLIAFDERVRAWARDNLQGLEVTGGGPVLMFAYLGERNVRSMLIALTAALILAAVVLGLSLRSWRVAVVGLVCNILPVLLVYSLWAVFKGRISLGAAVVMGMIIGIVIDDTIYLLTTYRRALAKHIADPVGHALRRIGPALIVTSITLVSSLSLGLLSDFEPIWSMSALSVAIIGLALLVDLLLLPAMLPGSKQAGRRRGATRGS